MTDATPAAGLDALLEHYQGQVGLALVAAEALVSGPIPSKLDAAELALCTAGAVTWDAGSDVEGDEWSQVREPGYQLTVICQLALLAWRAQRAPAPSSMGRVPRRRQQLFELLAGEMTRRELEQAAADCEAYGVLAGDAQLSGCVVNDLRSLEEAGRIERGTERRTPKKKPAHTWRRADGR